jgi:hypothetical protein
MCPFVRFAAPFLASAALLTTAAAAQQPSPVIPPSAPMVGLDGKMMLGAVPSAPIPDARGGAGPHAADKVKSVDPPRAPVDPKVFR